MNKKLLFKRICQAAIVFGLMFIGYCARKGDEERALVLKQVELDLYKQYYVDTEALLDSIYNQKNNWFLDVLIEQDVYAKYLETVEKIND